MGPRNSQEHGSLSHLFILFTHCSVPHFNTSIVHRGLSTVRSSEGYVDMPGREMANSYFCATQLLGWHKFHKVKQTLPCISHFCLQFITKWPLHLAFVICLTKPVDFNPRMRRGFLMKKLSLLLWFPGQILFGFSMELYGVHLICLHRNALTSLLGDARCSISFTQVF